MHPLYFFTHGRHVQKINVTMSKSLILYMYTHDETQLPWLQAAIHYTGQNVECKVTHM